ncbi:MAG: Ig-like domain-containing protein [Pseudomonas sp.]|uniref:Ig-like domain-containing protein n=1 Tax=Pseudomonas sp. TaxID=306 RepID=UPI003BB76982
MRPPQHRFALILASLTIAACLASAGLAADPAHSSAAQPDPASEQTARQAASSRTQDLLSLHQRWQQAAPQDKQQSRELLLAQAEQRRQMLAELVKSHPAEVLRVAIPADKQAGLPAELLALLEEAVEVEGELEVVYVDNFEDPSQSRIEHVLKTAFGERFTLHEAAGSTKELQTGQQVRLNGLLIPPAANAGRSHDGDIVVGSFDEDILSLAANNSASYGSQPGVQANTVGEQRTLVMMVNFQDAPSNKPWTSADMQALMDNQVSAFYKEVSYNQTWLKTTVFGWQTLATSSSSCDRTAITNLADQAATAAGHNVASYDRLIYVFPQTSSCGWGGLGTVGGKPSRVWVNGKLKASTYTHELGHNLGLYHSHDLDCGSASMGSNCTVSEYGDTADTMGLGNGHFNAYQKDRLGWFGNNIATVTASGTYRLAPHEFIGNQPLALKALKSTDPSTGAKTWYYLEYRQAIGLDSGLSFYEGSGGNLHKGVSIHSAVDLNGNTSYMLDMTPASAAWYDAALVPGARFSDSATGISVTTLSASASEALVDVSLGAEQCTQANPTVSLTASSDNWVTAGTAVSYSLTVTNRDGGSCGSRSFSLSAGVPSGWSKSLSKSALSLAPGASASATLTVTSASGATAAIYDISASAVSGNNSATATAAYVVEAAASNSAPVAKNDSGSTSTNTAVTVAVLTNDTDPDGDSLSVTTISGVSNGTAKLNSNGTISFTPASGYSGTTGFSYSISDGKGGSASAQVSVSVATSSLQAPVANADQVSLSSLSPVVIPVLANDSDPQGAKLTVIGVTQGSKGSVTVNAGGSLTYSPSRGLKTSDSFTYTISNGSKSASASVTVTLQQSSGSTGGKGKGNGKNG